VKPRLLLVEDDRALRDLLSDELETEGYPVDAVAASPTRSSASIPRTTIW
jgi:DNA-binding response OmpR family regulator